MTLFRRTLIWSFVLFALPLSASHVQHGPSPVPRGTVSTELLRYPLSGKALQMLQKALQISNAGDHKGAAKQLEKTLTRCHGTGAYVYSLLGVEYLKTGQIPEAVDALEQAVNLLPHDASNHANLGLALVMKGEYHRAEPELRRALDLDPHSAVASKLLNALEISQAAQK